MTNNIWYFTFGLGSVLKDRIQPIQGGYDQARELMLYTYGHSWSEQYGPEEAQEQIGKHHYKVLPMVTAHD